MSWIAITKDTLYEAKLAALIDACDAAALAETQDPRSPGLIQGVVNEVRSAVASCANNRVDADEATVPENLRDLCVDLIVARLKNSIEQSLTDDERSAVEWRRRQLRDIAACDLVVDQPDTPITPEVE